MFLDGMGESAALGVIVWHFQHLFVLSGTCDGDGPEGRVQGQRLRLSGLLAISTRTAFK
jgi:hypothetical protein